MRAVVVYESMYGNTHLIADAIADGLGGAPDVRVVPVEGAEPGVLRDADLLVIGGPTHAHSMTWPSTRKAAVEAAAKPGSDLELDPDAEGPGLRDWFDTLGELDTAAAAFDTRIDAPPVVTGRASKAIAKKLRHHGCSLVSDPESFLVTKENHLEPEEEQRARRWGESLRSAVVTA
jgi:Flavodoxin